MPSRTRTRRCGILLLPVGFVTMLTLPVPAARQALARVVYVHICLLLETEAQASPTRSLVWRAEQCLREWDRLERSGLTQGAGVLDPRHVAALQRWAKTADSDLYLAEALHGSALPPTKTLQVGFMDLALYLTVAVPIAMDAANADRRIWFCPCRRWCSGL